MWIEEIVLGVKGSAGPITLRLLPLKSGISIVPVDLGEISPGDLARALRETLAGPEREAAHAALPFARIIARTEDLELAVADDSAAGVRMLSETRPGGVSMILEATEPDQIDTLLSRVALAAGAEDSDTLLVRLERRAPSEAAREADATTEELAYVDLHRRAAALAREVRAVDDRMTASVVPDWLWIATGFGGAGVFMTAIAFLYPELRIYVIPMMSVVAMIGFLAYGYRAWRELKIRGALQLERAELRGRRESARSELRAMAASLRATGIDPDQALVRLSGLTFPSSIPAILGPDSFDAAEHAVAGAARQVLIFVPASSIASRAIEAGLIRTLDRV